MSEIFLKVTTLDVFKESIQDSQVNLVSTKEATSSEYNAFSPEMSSMMVSFLLGIPASMIASFLMERIKPFIKKNGNEVIIQGRNVQIKLDPNSTDIDFENAVLKLTPKE